MSVSERLNEILRLQRDIKQEVELLGSRGITPSQIIIVEGLSDIAERLGLINAGEFRAGNNKEIGDGFSGVRMGYPGFYYPRTSTASTDYYHLVGVDGDTLQFGLRASDGAALFGGGADVLDKYGLHIYDTGGKPAFIALSQNEVINSESLGAGDVLMGDNDLANILWDRSDQQLEFRGARLTQSYIDALGRYVSGGDAVKIDQKGVRIYNDASIQIAPAGLQGSNEGTADTITGDIGWRTRVGENLCHFIGIVLTDGASVTDILDTDGVSDSWTQATRSESTEGDTTDLGVEWWYKHLGDISTMTAGVYSFNVQMDVACDWRALLWTFGGISTDVIGQTFNTLSTVASTAVFADPLSSAQAGHLNLSMIALGSTANLSSELQFAYAGGGFNITLYAYDDVAPVAAAARMGSVNTTSSGYDMGWLMDNSEAFVVTAGIQVTAGGGYQREVATFGEEFTALTVWLDRISGTVWNTMIKDVESTALYTGYEKTWMFFDAPVWEWYLTGNFDRPVDKTSYSIDPYMKWSVQGREGMAYMQLSGLGDTYAELTHALGSTAAYALAAYMSGGSTGNKTFLNIPNSDLGYIARDGVLLGGDVIRIGNQYTPGATDDIVGGYSTGMIAVDDNYIYVHNGTEWKRAALSTYV